MKPCSQLSFNAIILQMYNPIKYFICITCSDYTLQAWGKSDNWWQVNNQCTVIILQMYNPIKYFIYIICSDYTLQAWGKSDNWL